jgi:AAHS family 4-hydroxybenzoate transporter-like MFS transporter
MAAQIKWDTFSKPSPAELLCGVHSAPFDMATSTSTASTAALTVGEIIEQRPLGAYQIWITVLCGLVLVLDGFDSQAINYIGPPLSDVLHFPLKNLGSVFSAGLFGLMIGAMTSGPIADRWGRKWPVILSTLSFAGFSLVTVHVASYRELLALRFLTGLGLGGAMPNVVALASEFVPRRVLPQVVTLLFVGMPLGGVVCGLLSAAVIPRHGWPLVLYIGGTIPLAIALLLIAGLPESIGFLAAQGKDPRKIARILARIAPDADAANVRPTPRDTAHEGVPVKHLFTEGRTFGTILLWIPYFMNLLIIYFIGSWLPALLRQSGLSVAAGSTAAAFFSFGGVFGCLCEGWLIKKFGAFGVLLGEFGLATASIAALSRIPNSYSLMVAVAFASGLMVIGAQGGLNAIAANFYPTAVRSTGLGWALGVGRVGSIVGPLLGGMLLGMGWKPGQILMCGTVAAACAFVAIALSRAGGRATAYKDAPVVAGH